MQFNFIAVPTVLAAIASYLRTKRSLINVVARKRGKEFECEECRDLFQGHTRRNFPLRSSNKTTQIECQKL